MNKLIKKTAAIVTAALMTISSIGAECFALAPADGVSVAETTVAFGAIVAKPTYKVKGGAGVRRVLLTCSTKGATIYYTTNGTVPTTKSKQYKANTFIKLTKKTQIRAIAVVGTSKSEVMTKTFQVATLYGDVTGDGKINSTDYARLKSYFNKTTDFICKDNADCDGSGGLNKTKDLGVLAQYLNGKISKLPAKYVSSTPTVSSTLAAPTVSQTKIYGGVSVSLSGSDSGATYYYTLSGSTPTNTSSKYTFPFTVEKNATLKVVSYKDGAYSSVKTTTINIAKAAAVYANKDPALTYEQMFDLELKCSSESSIVYYTTDGTDPKTSNTVAEYKEPVPVNKDTTVKAYAKAKGCADSDVITFAYKVNAAFNITGTVWDDTPGTSTVSEGKKTNGEVGIEGLNVYLMNASSVVNGVNPANNYVKKTVTDKNGYYAFENLVPGVEYKVMFEYNGQKYRGYGSLVDGGNQAIPVDVPEMMITNKGAYTLSSSGLWDNQLSTVNNYKAAITDSYFTMYAATTRSYTSATANVDFALISKNYGILDLEMKVEGQTSAGTAKKGDRLTYTITLTNNSPMAINSLKDVTIAAYMPRCCTSYDVQVSGGSRSLSQPFVNSMGFMEIDIWDLTGSNGLAPGKTITIVIVTAPDKVETGDVLRAYAEVTSYSFAFPCYDYNSVPGNFTSGNVREKDEATCDTITISSVAVENTTTKKITAIRSSYQCYLGDAPKEDALIVVVKNATSVDDAIVGAPVGNSIVWREPERKVIEGELYLYFTIQPSNIQSGKTTITVYLAADPKKKVTLTVYVRE